MSSSFWKRPAAVAALVVVVIALVVAGVVGWRTSKQVPSAPQSVTAVAGDSSVTVSWSAPSSDGGAPITQYRVSASPGSGTCTSTSTSCTITGLSNGTAYTFSVTASNSAGTGAVATSNAVTPNYAACVPFFSLPSRPLSADVLAALTAYYTTSHLTPISIVGNRERILNVADQTIGVHHCLNADGSVAGYTGMVPANATAAVEVEVHHQPYPVTGGSVSFAVLAQTAAGWKVVSEGTGP